MPGDAVERGDEVHLRGAGIAEAGIDAAFQQAVDEAFGAVHGRVLSGSRDRRNLRDRRAVWQPLRRRAHGAIGPSSDCRSGWVVRQEAFNTEEDLRATEGHGEGIDCAARPSDRAFSVAPPYVLVSEPRFRGHAVELHRDRWPPVPVRGGWRPCPSQVTADTEPGTSRRFVTHDRTVAWSQPHGQGRLPWHTSSVE